MHPRAMARPSASVSQHVFAYGSLVDPRCLDDVLGHVHAGERLPARLAGYRRIVSHAYAFPFIVAAPGSSVDGVLLMDLDPHDLTVLDRYEEVETGAYTRQVVEVETWGCGPRTLHIQAFTYVAGPALIASTSS
jgi:gamma-glutamylcyclotransferase (GGCT)/AIG2-like uncharacterized protein YtfP